MLQACATTQGSLNTRQELCQLSYIPSPPDGDWAGEGDFISILNLFCIYICVYVYVYIGVFAFMCVCVMSSVPLELES